MSHKYFSKKATHPAAIDFIEFEEQLDNFRGS